MKKSFLKVLDQHMEDRARAEVMALALGGVLLIGGIDYLTGFEISVSLLYLGPVAATAWYVGKPGYPTIALLCCIVWYLADLAAGSHDSHGLIPIWNALVRLGIFLTTGVLFAALRESFLIQQSLARAQRHPWSRRGRPDPA